MAKKNKAAEADNTADPLFGNSTALTSAPELKKAVYDHVMHSIGKLSPNKVAGVWEDPENWTRMSILNTARAGKFSSDRAIREYCDEICNVRATPIVKRIVL